MCRFLKAAVKFANINKYGAQVLTVRRCTTTSTCVTHPAVIDVPGLSKKIVDVPSENVGFPEASKKAVYKNPEYFCYHNVSYFEAEVEMMKYRLPQPKAKK